VVAGKHGCNTLSGRNFRTRTNHHSTGNSHRPLFRPNSRPRQHCLDRFGGNVRADRSKIPIHHFEDLRAIKPICAQLPPVFSKSSQKHKNPFCFKIRVCAEFSTNIPTDSANVKCQIQNMQPPRNIVGPVIRELREKKGITQAQLATKLNLAGWDLSRDTLAKIEAQIRCVSDFELPILAICVGTDPFELLRLAIARTPKRPRA
jgi:DNA-binding XRE family transcriptional regulator